MGEALKQFHPEDIEVTETRVGRKHEVTAIHKPTGISVIKDGLSFQITRSSAWRRWRGASRRRTRSTRSEEAAAR